jgi:hypothetical protein
LFKKNLINQSFRFCHLQLQKFPALPYVFPLIFFICEVQIGTCIVWFPGCNRHCFRIEKYSVEITYVINSVISKLMTFVENAETGQFLFLIMFILSCYTYDIMHPFLSYDVITNFFK